MPRCPNGSRKNRKTGKCVQKGSRSRSPVSSSTRKKRCPKGYRRSKRTGNCEETYETAMAAMDARERDPAVMAERAAYAERVREAAQRMIAYTRRHP